MDSMADVGDEHIHNLSSPPEQKEIKRSTEADLYQFVLLTSKGIEITYEAWMDYSLLDRLPKRVVGLIFIVGLMSFGVCVMMSRTALVKESQISDELLRRTAQVPKRIIRGEDVASRVGGDQFTVLFCETTELSEEQLLNRLETIFADEEIDISIGRSFRYPA